MIIPVITGATGILRKVYRKIWNHNSKTLHKFTKKDNYIGTSHTIRKVLQSENGGLRGGDQHWFES